MGEKQLSDLTVKQDSSTEDVLEILKFVKPLWKKEDIEIEMLSGGFSCLMFKCQNNNDADDAITIRARNRFGHLPINDHLFEEKVLKIMSDLNYFPKILGTFKNGYCYTYIQGIPIYKATSRLLRVSEKQIRCIARQMADIHNVKVVDADYSETNYFKTIPKCLEEFYARGQENFPTYEDLKASVEFLEEKLLNKGYTVGLCHGDPHVGNIVWTEEDDPTFLGDKEIPDDFGRKFLRCYLERVAENEGRSSAEVTDNDVDNIEKQVSMFKMLTSVYLTIIFGCLFVESEEKTPSGFVKFIYSSYLKNKDSVFDS